MATASLILGIVGILLSCVLIGIIPSIVGFILGIIAIKRNARKKKTAIVGTVLSGIGIILFIIIMVMVLKSDSFKEGIAEGYEDATNKTVAEETEAEFSSKVAESEMIPEFKEASETEDVKTTQNGEGNTEQESIEPSDEEIFEGTLSYSKEELENETSLEETTSEEETFEENLLLENLKDILSPDIAEKAYDIIVNQIGFTEVEFIGKNEVGNSNYDFDSNEYSFTMTASDDVYRIFQPGGGAVFYEDGEVKQTIAELMEKVIDSDDQSAYYIIAKEIVEECLVNPRSADFPSIIFSASDIVMQRKGNIVGVQSYVDSKNALGAVVRSKWLVEFEVTDLDSFSYNTLYIQIDGKTTGEFIDLN